MSYEIDADNVELSINFIFLGLFKVRIIFL